MEVNKPLVIFLLGPTASGKTNWAIHWHKTFPEIEIISVDSVMVYQGCNIGSAKPSIEVLTNHPHHLIDIVTLGEIFSVSDFCQQANNLISNIHKRKKIPLLVGGSMMYFNLLKKGINKLPSSNKNFREKLYARLNNEGIEKLYEELYEIDKKAAIKIQKKDFSEIFATMDGLPVTIRLLDPPLHEFMPQNEDQIRELALELNISSEAIKDRIAKGKEGKKRLGNRGCRLGVVYPEITEMQSRALFEATVTILKEGKKVSPEVMIPLVGTHTEFENQENIVRRIAEDVMQKSGITFDYLVGTMIELPRAALTADEIAKKAEFFSFGTNDLTQTTYGFSRDDIGSFLQNYLDQNLLPFDPFQSIDESGVGQLIQMGVEKGRSTRKNLKIGICGEHGGDPKSIEFCHKINLDYVSCSPFRVPVARLSAAHAALNNS